MNDRRMSKNYCTYCQNVVEGVRIRCAECPDIDLCLPCFTCGAEFGNHKRDHGYIVLDNLDFHIYGEIINWTAGEELLLLDSVEQYGFGNWNDISSHVETKNSEECKNHYIALYIHGNIGKVTFPITSTVRIKDHTFTETYSSSSQPLPPAELTLQEQHELGYMPYRDDFERDYDNFAEVDISSLALHRDDDDIDTAFKLAQVDEYRQRLKERQRRKNIAREHGLLSQFFLNRQQPVKVTKKKAVKDERDLQQRLNVFAQVLSRTEKETFFEGLDKERYLKQKIKELQKYRRNGITKLEDCQEYDEEKNVRDKKKDTKKKKVPTATLR